MCDHMVTLSIITVNIIKCWCLLKQHVSAHVLSLKMVHVGRNTVLLTFRHHASSTRVGQTFRYSPEKAFHIFNQQIYFIIFFETC
jgi:hypothetical protein